jgi:hypothetical protein
VATDATELVVALVTALVMALAKLAAIRRPESLLAAFIKVCLRTDCAMDMRAPVTVATCGHSKALERRPILR